MGSAYMKIAMISTPFLTVPPRDYGGTELVVYELVEGLIRRGHEVTLFATGDSRTSARLRWIYNGPQWPPHHLPDVDHVTWAMREVAREGDFDVVHAHSPVALGLRRLIRQPGLVYTLHHHRDSHLSSFYRNCHDAHFVAISRDQARREIPLPRLSVVHHGLDPYAFSVSLHPSEYVCFLSRLAEVKGPATAIDVARQAGLPIRVAGSVHPVDQSYAHRELVHRLRQKHVTHLGPVGLEAKVRLLRDARALLAPITWNEPFGLNVIEAMLSGCPVVGFPRGSLPELIESGITGFLVRDAGEMAAVIGKGGPLDGFDRLRCRARAIEQFSNDRMVAEYEDLYARVTAGDPHVRPSRSSRVA
jgi:glycosyltransferase involved in cell wall biosynthesis